MKSPVNNRWSILRGTEILFVLVMICAGCGQGSRHGEEFLVEIHSHDANDSDYQHTVGALKKRLGSLGFGTTLEPAGTNRLRIRIGARPLSAEDKTKVRRRITDSTVLEFRLVHSESDDLLKRGVVPPDWETLECKRRNSDDTSTTTRYIVKKEPVGGLSYAIERASPSRDNLNRPAIAIQFSPEGTRALAELTRTNVGQCLAMVLNRTLIAAPRIDEPIDQGSAVIAGDFTREEVYELASVLEAPFAVPITLLEERSF